MKRIIALAIWTGCGTASRSSFDFVLAGDSTEHVHSGARVSGSVNNAGALTLADPDMGWSLHMSLAGLSTGTKTLGNKVGEVSIIRKIGTPAVFTTALGGTCTVIIDPHNTSNGDIVTGTFFCNGVLSAAGQKIDVPHGEFRTFINDESNNASLDPPRP